MAAFRLSRMLRPALACLMLAACLPVSANERIRVKDLGKLQGWRENPLIGYGLVTGLAGSGDSTGNRATRQAMTNLYSRFSFNISPDQVQSRNVALVMVTASLPAFAREGDSLDVTVTSTGDARSLVGGTLLAAPLRGPDGKVYALAQGSLSNGGYRYDANGNLQQKNHPTASAIPGGAVVEQTVTSEVFDKERKLTFVLANPDYTTASRVAAAINSQLGADLAEARDATGIDIRMPAAALGHAVAFLSRIENVDVEPDRRAKVVINERTGTVVAGGDVRIARVTISQGSQRISIMTENSVSQPLLLADTGSGVRTATVANSRIEVDEPSGPAYVGPVYVTVADLVQWLAKTKTSTRDMISILRSIKAEGALYAELIMQ